MSKMAENVLVHINKLFPHETVISEHYINYRNQRLFFDYYIKSLRVLVEIQGEQHFKYVKQFHGSRESFFAQKRRDNLKLEWCEENDMALVYFYDKTDVISDRLVIDRIFKAQNEAQ